MTRRLTNSSPLVVVKASPGSDERNKLKGKNKSKKDASSRGSESPSTSESDARLLQDSSIKLLKGNKEKSEVACKIQEEKKLGPEQILFKKRTEETYILKGAGTIPVDVSDAVGALEFYSFSNMRGECGIQGRVPHKEEVKSTIDSEEYGNLSHVIELLLHPKVFVASDEFKHLLISMRLLAGSIPCTKIDSWKETIHGPETIVTDVDSRGNVVKRMVRTEQVKHTVHKETFHSYNMSGQGKDNSMNVIETAHKSFTPSGEINLSKLQAPLMESDSHTYKSKSGSSEISGKDYSDIPGDLVSSRTITQGNRTIETITYKTERDGVIETHVEHRVTISSSDDIDHDAELSQAILEATKMNPDMAVEKIEVKQESQC
ncbi:unnamed protein product [Thelazia callipaeda]|uniref:4_1_CTD domain-containing protein n=1 Tax=Thelazia callipaeda TaxID=103827 RepID=A0A0N5D228_THECL|nr:unnamed protein product [Thelazia callipaeda]